MASVGQYPYIFYSISISYAVSRKAPTSSRSKSTGIILDDRHEQPVIFVNPVSRHRRQAKQQLPTAISKTPSNSSPTSSNSSVIFLMMATSSMVCCILAVMTPLQPAAVMKNWFSERSAAFRSTLYWSIHSSTTVCPRGRGLFVCLFVWIGMRRLTGEVRDAVARMWLHDGRVSYRGADY